MNWLKAGTGVLSGIFLAFILYGSWQYYFKKPVPIVNNTTVSPGATMNVEQAKIVNKGGHLYTGLSGGKDAILVEVGWLW